MDPALRNRLIGASVLIVLAMVFLPMLFDGGRNADSELIGIDVADAPARDFETRVVPLDLPAAAGTVAAAVGDGDQAGAAGGPEPAPEGGVTEPAEPPELESLVTVEATSSKPAEALPEPATATAPAVASTNPDPEPAPDAAVTAAQRSGRFVVNLGSYANAGNANDLVALLGKSGLHPSTEVLDRNGTRVTRLRLGPYPTRGQAEATRLKVRAVRSDVPASISEIDDSPAADVGTAKPARSVTGAYAVQVAVLSDQARANQQRDQLRGAGFAAFVEKLDTATGTVFRVRVGPEASRDNAIKRKGEIKQRFAWDAIIVDYP